MVNFGFPAWLLSFFGMKQVKPSSQPNENKARQRALIADGHKEIKANGSWGPYQNKLWQEYKRKNPEAARAVLDLAPTVAKTGNAGLFTAHAYRTQGGRDRQIRPTSYDINSPSPHNKRLNDHYYKLVTDSIKKREQNGFYRTDPEMRARDRKMAQQYKDAGDSPLDWSCITSVTGLFNGHPVISNFNFRDKARALGFKKTQTPEPFSVIQEVNEKGSPQHAVYNLGSGLIYNTHGFVTPFKNGNQLEKAKRQERIYPNRDEDGHGDDSGSYIQNINYYDPYYNIFWKNEQNSRKD